MNQRTTLSLNGKSRPAPARTVGGSLDQRRAAFAWQRVAEHAGAGGFGDYVNLAKAAPALVMGNGLMQALAFYRSKGKGHHERLLEDLCRWLAERRLAPGGEFAQAMDALLKSDPAQYRAATEECLALLRWVRQFAAALKTK